MCTTGMAWKLDLPVSVPLSSFVFVIITNRVILISAYALLLLSGIYQPETFKRESKYGLTVLTTTDQGLLSYLGQVMSQMESWLTDGDVQRLVVVVSGIDSGETLERWQFNVSVEDGSAAGMEVSMMSGNDENVSHNVMAKGSVAGDNKIANKNSKGSKTVKDVHDEIQAIIRQITASVRMKNQNENEQRLASFFFSLIFLCIMIAGHFPTSLE